MLQQIYVFLTLIGELPVDEGFSWCIFDVGVILRSGSPGLPVPLDSSSPMALWLDMISRGRLRWLLTSRGIVMARAGRCWWRAGVVVVIMLYGGPCLLRFLEYLLVQIIPANKVLSIILLYLICWYVFVLPQKSICLNSMNWFSFCGSWSKELGLTMITKILNMII